MSEKFRKSIIIAAAGTLGFSSILTQVLFLREFLGVLTGNELLIGILLSNWMLLTGAGAYAGRFVRTAHIKGFILSLHSLLAILPLISMLILFRSRYLLFTPGLELNLTEITIFSLLLLAPFCLIAGLLFNLYASFLHKAGQAYSIARIYSAESLGSFLGGLFSAFILISFLNLYHSLLVIIVLNMIISLVFNFTYVKTWAGFSVPLQLVAIGLLILFIPSELGKSRIYPGQELILNKESNYGNLAVTKTGNQFNFYENGALLFTSKDDIHTEEMVHFSMSLHENPQNILVISGNYSALTKEINKYDNTEISYVEMNPAVVKAQEALINNITQNPVVFADIVIEDPVRFLNNSHEQYDLIIMNQPPPSSAMLNRLYTSSFFSSVKKQLRTNGIFAFSFPAAENYYSDRLLELLSSIHHTLGIQFEETRVISGSRIYFLASRKSLEGSILNKIRQRKIDNLYINEHYIREDLLNMRSELLQENLSQDAPVNTDLRPLAYYYELRNWLEANKVNIEYILIFLIIAVFLVLVISVPINFALFTGGFTAASLEFILILAFQVIYAYVYQFIGLIIAVFMLGLYLGSFAWSCARSKIKKGIFIKVHISIGHTAILIPLMVFVLNDSTAQSFIIQGAILLMTLLISFLTGTQYALASRLITKETKLLAGKTYLADMTGSAIGILTTSVFLVPLYGIVGTGLILLVFNAISIANIYLRHGRI